MNSTEQGLTLLATVLGGAAALQYCRRWLGGWGTFVVPMPAYHLVLRAPRLRVAPYSAWYYRHAMHGTDAWLCLKPAGTDAWLRL